MFLACPSISQLKVDYLFGWDPFKNIKMVNWENYCEDG